MRGEELLDWHERGDRFTLDTTLDGALRVYVLNEGIDAEILLGNDGIKALISAVDELAGGRGWIPEITYEQTLEELGDAEHALDAAEQERDEAVDRATELEAELRARVAEVEQLKTALDLADRRAHEVEQLAERLEQDAETDEYRGGSYARDVLVDVSARVRKVIS